MMAQRSDGAAEEEVWSGRLLAVYVAERAGVEMHSLENATFVEGHGINGDRYALGKGHYSSRWHPDRQVTAIAQEVIDDVARQIDRGISAIETRRNLITRDVPLNTLVGEIFQVGTVVLYGGRLNVPCRYLERLIDKPVFEPLVGRSGLNCQILRGGTVHPGDSVTPILSAERDDSLMSKVAVV